MNEYGMEVNLAALADYYGFAKKSPDGFHNLYSELRLREYCERWKEGADEDYVTIKQASKRGQLLSSRIYYAIRAGKIKTRFFGTKGIAYVRMSEVKQLLKRRKKH